MENATGGDSLTLVGRAVPLLHLTRRNPIITRLVSVKKILKHIPPPQVYKLAQTGTDIAISVDKSMDLSPYSLMVFGAVPKS